MSVRRQCLSWSIETGKPVEKSDIDHFGFSVRNVYSAQNQFPAINQTKGIVDQTGNLWKKSLELLRSKEERSSQSVARKFLIIRTPSSSSRTRTQHSQEESWRQQQDFLEVHQQNLTEMKELQNFQSSTFDTLVRRKLTEDQNTIMELSGRLQELQNEVNCMNDPKDFQDAESVRSGNSRYQSTRIIPQTSSS